MIFSAYLRIVGIFAQLFCFIYVKRTLSVKWKCYNLCATAGGIIWHHIVQLTGVGFISIKLLFFTALETWKFFCFLDSVCLLLSIIALSRWQIRLFSSLTWVWWPAPTIDLGGDSSQFNYIIFSCFAKTIGLFDINDMKKKLVGGLVGKHALNF